MNNSSKQQTSKPIYKVVSLQACIAAVFAILATVMTNSLNGLSSAAGGMIAGIGSLIYAMNVVGKEGDATSIMKAHFRAEMMKVFVTAVLFALVLLLFHSVALLWLILGFAVATLAYWFALLIV